MAEVGNERTLRQAARDLVTLTADQRVALTGEHGLLTELAGRVLQTGLEAELGEHLRDGAAGVDTGTRNMRNGAYRKRLMTGLGPVELRVPRDRLGTFVPRTVPKHVRRLPRLGETLLLPFARDMDARELRRELREDYLAGLPDALAAAIASELLPTAITWRKRTLERATPLVLLDTVAVGPEGRCELDLAIGLGETGTPALLSLQLAQPDETVAARFTVVVADLLARGLPEPALISCRDPMLVIPAVRQAWRRAVLEAGVEELVHNLLAPQSQWGRPDGAIGPAPVAPARDHHPRPAQGVVWARNLV